MRRKTKQKVLKYTNTGRVGKKWPQKKLEDTLRWDRRGQGEKGVMKVNK